MQEVKIDLGSTLAHSMLSELHNSSSNNQGKAKPNHIPRVPPNIRNIDNAAYDPKVISIGPYHHGKSGLQSMEDHKKRYLREFLTCEPENSSITTDVGELEKLDSLINTVRISEKELLSWYSLPPNIKSDDFIKMIVLDGCFILRLLIKFRVRSERGEDPIFLVGNLLPLLRGDLLLLENQLPFFILEKLYELIQKPDSKRLTLKEFAFAYLTFKDSTGSVNNLEVYHLLHLYDLILLPKVRDVQSNQNALSTVSSATKLKVVPSTVPSATKLKEAGIKLLPAKEADNFLEVFYVKGKLQIPCLKITDVTIPIFRNLIAFEQCCPIAGNHFTAYTRFMDLMVNNTEDVKVLEESKIIENKLGSEDEVVHFLNQIFTDVIIDHQKHYLTPVFTGIDAYCSSRWHRHQAKFWQDYCSSPWAGISVSAATVLLLLTLLQTIYTIMSYYNI
ncbi:hypothetical protein J5N97_024699 [Dioscorea zingiberensis]|uniref:Uncharacterized protein n=1 Tax=Dioscorea zingiberensis TaxID=325984 RepID=A0A9D5C8D9_9LILI|nr:hypothetical protein J5N97_024699 [Dioscorea zingiberensis]